MASIKNDSKSNAEDNKKTQEDFEMNDVLGEGSYSTVFLAKEKATGKQYAIKVLDKRHIIKERKVKYVTIEKDVLNMCDHPFIIKLYYTFQDQNNLYFCLELCPGDLLKAIKTGGFSVEAVQFYAAELIEAVNYLHTMRILHRDLKPENILLSDKNHIKLTDYGTAKILGRNEEVPSETKTKSFVGTAEYVSPEVLSERDASEASDFWAIGCIMVQMLTQKPPFKGPNDYQTFQKVSKLQYSLPLDFPDRVKQITSKLIQLEPLNRATYSELLVLDFFKPLVFKDLYLKTPPSFYPTISLEKDETEGQDEMGKFDAPKRKSRISFGALSKVSTKSSNNSTISESYLPDTDPTKLLSNISDQSVLLISDFLKPEEQIIKMGILYKKKGLVPRKRWFVLTDLPRFMYFKGNAMILKENSKYEQDVPQPVKAVKKEKDKEKSDSDDSGEVIEQKTIGELTFKGLIHWTDEIDVEFKNKTTFIVNTPKRAYYLIDQTGNAETWCESIRTVKMLANPNTLHK